MAKEPIDIPEILFSFNTGAPFTHCLECETDLQLGEVDYFVEKVFRNYKTHQVQDVIIDYAICINCAQNYYEKISPESMLAIQKYLGPAMAKNNSKELDASEELFSTCLVHETPVSESEEYQIFGHCRGDKLILENPPYAIGWQAIEEMSNIISKKTKDEMDDFFQKHFTPDPDLFASPTKPRLVLI